MLAHHRRPVPWTGTLGWIWLGSGFSWSTEAIEELFLQIAPVPVLLTSAVGDKWVLLSEFGSVHAPSSISLSVPSQRSCAKAALLLGDVYVCDYNTMIWSNTTMYGVFCHIVLMSWHIWNDLRLDGQSQLYFSIDAEYWLIQADLNDG